MKDIEIKISKETRMVDLTKTIIGNESENLQGNLIFSFTDEFVDGIGRLEYQINNENGYIMLLKQDETYYIPIKSILTKKGQINMQLVITEGTSEEEIPVFKSNVFYMTCNKSINAEIEAPDEYNQWIDIANAKLNELEEAIKEVGDIDRDITNVEQDITILKSESGTKVTLSIDDNYLMTLNLINMNDEIVSTANIDFPIESMIVNAEYSNGILTLTLQNGNKLNVDISDIVKGLVSENTFENAVKELENKIEDNIGKEIQLDFNAVLENNEIIANLDESIKDYELQNNTGYLFHIYLPLVTLTGDLDNDYPIYLMDKDFNKININTIFQKDITKTSTVGDMCQIQDYDVGIGYSWEFYGHFRKINDNGNEINVIYTDTIVRETNPSLSGEQLHKDVVNSKLKVGTTVMCLSNYENNGSKYEKGHTYLIENQSDTEEIILIATDITVLYDDTTIKQNITNLKEEQEKINAKNTEQDTKITENTNKISTLQEDNENQNTNISKNTESIESLQEENTNLQEKITILEQENTELKEDVKAQGIQGKAEGESITLNDSSSARFESIEVSGNSEQETGDVIDDSGEVIGTKPSSDYSSEVKSSGDNGNINEVICNKNLLPNNAITQTINGITFSINEGKTISVKGTATANAILNILGTNTLILLKGTYTLTGCPSGGGVSSNYKLDIFKQNENAQFAYDIGSGKTFTLNETAIFDRVRVVVFSGKTVDLIFKPKLEEGTTTTDYVEHQEQSYSIPTQQPFRKIGDYADTFVKENGKWYERHWIKEIIPDGTQTYVFENGWFALKVNGKTIVDGMPAADWILNGAIISNKLPTVSRADMTIPQRNYMGVSLHTTGEIALKLDNQDSTQTDWTVDTVNDYLKKNEIKIYYALAEPTLIECTEEQSTILEQLNNARTYKNITHIYSTDEVSPNMEVTYYKDMETVINNIQAMIISNASEEV